MIQPSQLRSPPGRPVGRRALLARGLSLAAGLTVGSGALAATPAPLASAAERLRAFVRMRGALDDRVVIGFVSGAYQGVVDGEATPLFGLSAATFARWRAVGDGYEVVGCEQAYFTDLETGQVLDSWRNPYTGATIKVPITASAPSKMRLNPDLTFAAAPTTSPGVSLAQMVSAPDQIGGEVFFTETIRARVALPGAPRPFRYNDATTMRAQLSDVLSPDGARAPCETSYQAILSWRPWLEMGDRSGQMVSFGQGRYGAALDELPPVWTEATRRARPALLDNPETVLDPLWRA